jgi:hypothetical protein
MSQTHLLLTITEEKMLETARGAPRVDIESLIESIPSAVVVSGDRSVSVHIEVDSNRAAEVRRVVQGVCTVDSYREMKLLDGRKSPGRRTFGR